MYRERDREREREKDMLILVLPVCLLGEGHTEVTNTPVQMRVSDFRQGESTRLLKSLLGL